MLPQVTIKRILVLVLLQIIKLANTLTLSSSIAHTVQLADKNPERIPEVSYSKASPDVDSETERDLGNISQFQLAGVFNYKGLNLWCWI